MTLKQAFDNMLAACKALQMNYDQHKTLDKSIEVVWEHLKDQMPNPVIEDTDPLENKSGAV